MALRQQQAAMQRELRQAAEQRAQLHQQVVPGTAAASDLLAAPAAPACMATLQTTCWQGSGLPHCCISFSYGAVCVLRTPAPASIS